MTLDTALLQVLFVENNLGDVALMESAFADHVVPTELHHVADGADALALLGPEGGYGDAPRPDLILLDLNMPRVDGRHVLNEIKADEELKAIPVVVFTHLSHLGGRRLQLRFARQCLRHQADRPRRLPPKPWPISATSTGYTVTLPRRISDLTRHDGSGGEAVGPSQPSS